MAEQYSNNANRYQITSQIGKGRMGDVYRCTDGFYRRELAMKVLRQGNFTPEYLRWFGSRFSQDISVLSKVNNPNIIHYYDFTNMNNMPAWTMELLPGTSYQQFCGQQIPYTQAANMLIPVADALAYVHQIGYVHGNLKPSNILINNANQPVLTDFFLTRWLSENGHGYGNFEAAAGIGSPEYLAPEQGQGQQFDARADVYALGIIFYELITGRKPFSAVSPLETMNRQINEQLPAPRYFAPNITPQVEQLIYQATAKNPAMRLNSMGEFALLLRNLAAEGSAGGFYPPASYYNNGAPSEDDEEEGPSIFEKVKDFLAKVFSSKRNKIIAAAVAALILIGAIIGIISSNNKRIAEQNAAATEQADNMLATQEAVRAEIEGQKLATQEAEKQAIIEQTKSAEMLQTAAAAPTSTPMVAYADISAAIPTAVPTVASGASARFQTQSPADGSEFILGEAFTVTWTLENTGGTDWNTNYKLVFNSGTNFTTGALKEKNIPDIVYRGGALGLSLPCTAPNVLGSHSMQWYLADDNGNPVFTPLTIAITVVDGELTETPVPTAEPEAATATPSEEEYYEATTE